MSYTVSNLDGSSVKLMFTSVANSSGSKISKTDEWVQDLQNNYSLVLFVMDSGSQNYNPTAIYPVDYFVSSIVGGTHFLADGSESKIQMYNSSLNAFSGSGTRLYYWSVKVYGIK